MKSTTESSLLNFKIRRFSVKLRRTILIPVLHQIIATRVLYGCHERRQQLRPLPGYVEPRDFPNDDGDLQCHLLSRLSQAAEEHRLDGGPLLVADGVGRGLSPRYETRVCKPNITEDLEHLIPYRGGVTISSIQHVYQYRSMPFLT